MAGPPNPLYDPDWSETYRAREDDCERWQKACHQIVAQSGFGSPRHLAAMAGLRACEAQAEQARLGQYRTIGDYAAWRFSTLPAARDGVDIVPDFAAFENIAEVDEAYGRAAARAGENAFIDEMSLPVRQPAGLAAFSAAESVVSSGRRFEAAELEFGSNATGEALDCVVSFQELAGPEYHFCLAHRWGDLSARSGDQFKNIATVLTRQAIIFSIPDAADIFQDGRHGMLKYRPLIRQVNEMATKFRFYRHLLPRRDLKEQFCRVAMAWNGARFIEPDFSVGLYDTIPAVLRAAAARFPEPAKFSRLPPPASQSNMA